MNGYAASARIHRPSARRSRAWEVIGQPLAAEPDVPAVAWIEASSDEVRRGRLSTRWTAFRERWSQLTFYLFDPDSWR